MHAYSLPRSIWVSHRHPHTVAKGASRKLQSHVMFFGESVQGLEPCLKLLCFFNVWIYDEIFGGDGPYGDFV